jgi:hypothetical protein
LIAPGSKQKALLNSSLSPVGKLAHHPKIAFDVHQKSYFRCHGTSLE